jgi:hypothetical protein
LEQVYKVKNVFAWYEYIDVRWENLKIQRRKDGEEDITTWMTMKRVIKKRFVLEYYK